MPLIDPQAITRLIDAILQDGGCAPAEALLVAEHLVEASLRGHDSHGVIRTTRYHQWLLQGVIRPNVALRTLVDAGALLQFDGGDGMGQRLAREAVGHAVERARDHGVAMMALRRGGHVGRLGAYAEQACAAGLFSVHFCNVAGSSLVAPFGGAGRLMSTAPMAVGAPHGDGADDFVLDFSTAVIAEGKAMVAARGGPPAPADALVDGQGRLTGDPAALYGATIDDAVPDPTAGPGALRAMGAHKGSGLAMACELLAGALTGNGCAGLDHPFGNGMVSILIDPRALEGGAGVAAEVAAFIAQARATRPAADVARVLTPGEPERARRASRLRDGLPMADAAFDAIAALAARLGIAAEGCRLANA